MELNETRGEIAVTASHGGDEAEAVAFGTAARAPSGSNRRQAADWGDGPYLLMVGAVAAAEIAALLAWLVAA
jgi:hypothetical protein